MTAAKPGEELCGQGRGRTADLPLFRRTLVPTELPAHRCWLTAAVLTGLEPATSALTGRRALQLLHRTLRYSIYRSYPQRDSNPCYRLERAASWAARRWGRPSYSSQSCTSCEVTTLPSPGPAGGLQSIRHPLCRPPNGFTLTARSSWTSLLASAPAGAISYAARVPRPVAAGVVGQDDRAGLRLGRARPAGCGRASGRRPGTWRCSSRSGRRPSRWRSCPGRGGDLHRARGPHAARVAEVLDLRRRARRPGSRPGCAGCRRGWRPRLRVPSLVSCFQVWLHSV